MMLCMYNPMNDATALYWVMEAFIGIPGDEKTQRGKTEMMTFT